MGDLSEQRDSISTIRRLTGTHTIAVPRRPTPKKAIGRPNPSGATRLHQNRVAISPSLHNSRLLSDGSRPTASNCRVVWCRALARSNGTSGYVRTYLRAPRTHFARTLSAAPDQRRRFLARKSRLSLFKSKPFGSNTPPIQRTISWCCSCALLARISRNRA